MNLERVMVAADDVALAHHLADLADAITRPAFTGESLSFETKDDGSPVTVTDLLVERTLQAALTQSRPRDAMLGEEVGAVGAVGAARRTWIVDGVDGTINFVAGRPSWATEIALVVDGAVAFGISTSPGLGRRWWGGPGHSSRVASLPVRSPAGGSTPLLVDRSVGGHTTMPGRRRFVGQPEQRLLAPLDELGAYLGAPIHGALLVAGGEVAVCLHGRGGPWDFAALAGIVTGAGGRFSDLDGNARLDHGGPVVYSNGVGHDRLLQGLRRARTADPGATPAC